MGRDQHVVWTSGDFRRENIMHNSKSKLRAICVHCNENMCAIVNTCKLHAERCPAFPEARRALLIGQKSVVILPQFSIPQEFKSDESKELVPLPIPKFVDSISKKDQAKFENLVAKFFFKVCINN